MRTPVPFAAYRLLDRLAVIGGVELWQAARKDTGRAMLVERVHPEACAPEVLAAFVARSRLAGASPHLAGPLEVGRADGWSFLAWDPAPGPDLADLREKARRRGEALPAGLVAAILAPAADGLDAFHRIVGRGHGRIAADAVILRPQGEVRLLPGPLLPWTEGEPAPPRAACRPEADLAAFGLLLVDLLAGEPGTLERRRDADLPGGPLPPPIERIVRRCLGAGGSPYPGARSLARDLEAVAREAGAGPDDVAMAASGNVAARHLRDLARPFRRPAPPERPGGKGRPAPSGGPIAAALPGAAVAEAERRGGAAGVPHPPPPAETGRGTGTPERRPLVLYEAPSLRTGARLRLAVLVATIAVLIAVGLGAWVVELLLGAAPP